MKFIICMNRIWYLLILCYVEVIYIQFTFLLLGFSLSSWMASQGLQGSLSRAVSDALLNTLGIGLFMKEKSCDRAEAPYSTNKLSAEGWSSGNFCCWYFYVQILTQIST